MTIALLAATSLFAQDMESATNLYNEGAQALNEGDKTTALKCFEDALAQGEALGAEAEELVFNCKKNIPVIILSIGKEQASAKNIDEAIATLKTAVEKAEAYGQAEIGQEAKDLIPQLFMQQGNIYLNQKDFENAINNYKKVLEINPNDGRAYLYLGQALSRTGDFQGALDALKKAEENGQEKNAKKVSSKLYLTLANAALQKKDFEKSLDYAEQSLAIMQDATALQIAGKAASALKNHDKVIEYFEKLIELNPNGNKAAEFRYTIATSYEAKGDKANACVNYKAIVSVPQFKEYATYKVKELKCQ